MSHPASFYCPWCYSGKVPVVRARHQAYRELSEREQLSESVGSVLSPLMRSVYHVHVARPKFDPPLTQANAAPPGVYYSHRCGRCKYVEVHFVPEGPPRPAEAST